MKNTNDVYAENVELIQEPGYLGVAYDLKRRQEYRVAVDIREISQFIIRWRQFLCAVIWES